MTPEQWRRVNDLYHAALETPIPSRSRFVEKHASDDTIVANELRRLLEVDTERTAIVDRPAGSLASLLAPVIAPGDHIAQRYRILGEVGSGGMGQVYEAVDEELNTRVALKIIRPELANEPRVLARFKQEVQLARQVTHPNVCRAYDLVRVQHRERELLILCMEFVDGETLSTRLRRDGKMKIAEAEPIIRQIAAGLNAAHAAGVVHRDLKSGNIFLSKTREGDLRVVLADFGLAGHAVPEEGVSRQTASGWGIGTPAYMAPEQVEGGKIGPAADIYALGVVMYEMATGQVPYEGQTPLQVAVRRLREKPRPPRELDASVDGKWESAILRCLEVEPADRFATAADAAQALHQTRWLPRTPNRLWRRRLGAAAAVAVVAAGAGVFWGSMGRGPQVPVQALSTYQKGLTALYDGNWPSAEFAFSQAIAAAPRFAMAHARRAEAQIEMERIDDARASLLSGVSAGYSQESDQQYGEAMLAYLTNEPAKATALLEKRVKALKDADLLTAQLDLARMYFRRREFAASLAVYTDITSKAPDNAMAWMQQARSHAGLGQRDKEKQAFEQAAAVLARFPDASLAKDLAYFRATSANFQLRPDALPLVEAAVKEASGGPTDFRSVRARLLEAEVLFRLGRLDEADEIRQAAQADASRSNLNLQVAQGFFVLGRALFAQSKLEKSVQVLSEAIQTADRYGAVRTAARSRLALASALTARGRDDDRRAARDLLAQVVQTTNRPGLADERMDARVARLNLARADRDFALAEKLGAEFMADAAQTGVRRYQFNAYENLQRLAVRQMKFVPALQYLEKAQTFTDPASANWFETGREIANVQSLLGRHQDALRTVASLRQSMRPLKASKGGLTKQALDLNRTEAIVLSEIGRSAEAHALILQTERDAASAQQDVAQIARMNRCMIEAEWHRYDLARVTCEALLTELKQKNESETSIRNVQRSLARAAYWGGDYARASQLVNQLRSQDLTIENWAALLTSAAVKRKLRRDLAAETGEIRQYIDRLKQQNGPQGAAGILNRRIYRELLDEIQISLN